MAAILEVDSLTHTYSAGTPFEQEALNGVSFSVEKGDFIGIIGHTGSGKSTLIQHSVSYTHLTLPTILRV